MKKIICGILLAVLFTTSYAQVNRSKAPEPGPAPKIQLGKYETFTLKNGLKVIVVENHKLPKINYSLVLDNDPTLEGNKAGYVQMLGEILGRGTKNRTKAQLDEAIDLIGADLYPSSGGLFASCLKKHNEKMLELMADVLFNPSFPQEELDKVIKQTRDGLQANQTDPSAITANMISKVAYGANHPYSDVVTDSTLSKITLADIKDYYTKNFIPNVAYLAIVGDVTKNEIQPLIEKYFGSWAKGTAIKNKIVTPVAPANTQIYMNDRAGSAQSTLRFVYPIQNNVGGEDYLRLRLLNNVLGGGATGRLFMNLREKHGYTYGAYSSMTADKYTGLFTASADVRTEVTDSAIFQFIYELNNLATNGVKEEELKSSKSELTGSFAIGLENPQTVANFAINIDRYKLPKDYYENYLTNLNAVTVADVNAAATKFILPYNFSLVVVGDRSQVEKKILKYDSDQKITFLDAFGNPAAELKPVPAGVTMQTIADAYVAALGGKDALNKIKDMTSKSKAVVGGGQVVEILNIYKAPDKTYSSFSLGGQALQTDIFNGTAGKTVGAGSNITYTEAQIKDAKADAAIAYEVDLAKFGITGTVLGIDMVNGTEAYKVEYVMPSGDKTFIWYNVKTALKIKSLTFEKDPEGNSVENVIEYMNYRAVDGVMFPHTIKTGFLGDIVVESIEINKGVSDDYFIIK